MTRKPRLVCWYSSGTASLVAAKKAIEMQPRLYPDHEVVVAKIHLESEYQEPRLDTMAAEWLGVPITTLRNESYGASVDTVIEKTRYMSGSRGARCTTELKKNVRKEWQRPDDVHVFGMTADEEGRIDRILDAEPELEMLSPLIELGLTKKDCFQVQADAGLPLATMYKLGYHNNNCIGCVKATGAGYWNKIRKDFPAVFERRSRQEYLLNVAVARLSKSDVAKYGDDVIALMDADGYSPKMTADGRMWCPLRYLPDGAGTHKDLNIGSCGFTCEMPD